MDDEFHIALERAVAAFARNVDERQFAGAFGEVLAAAVDVDLVRAVLQIELSCTGRDPGLETTTRSRHSVSGPAASSNAV